MKKTISFILTAILTMTMMCSVCVVNTMAAERNPYVWISGRSADDTNNWPLHDSTTRGLHISKECWVKYDNLNFTGMSRSMTIKAVWDNNSDINGVIQVRLGGPDGEILAEAATKNIPNKAYTEGTIHLDLSRPISGVQSICITGNKTATEGTSLNSFIFYEEAYVAPTIEDIQGEKYEDDINFAMASNLMPVDGVMFRPKEFLTRDEAAVVLATLALGARETVETEEAVKIVCGQGYMSAYSDGKFRGDGKIKYNDFVVAVFRLLGYNEKAGFKTISDYAKISDKLTKGTKPSGEYITRADAAHMLVNAMDIKWLSWMNVKGTNQYVNNKEHTLRNSLVRIFEETGIVEVSQNSSLRENALVENEADVVIDSVKYSATPSFDALVGKKVKIFYKDDYRNDFPEILSVRVLDDKMNIVDIEGQYIEKIESRTYYYYDPITDKRETMSYKANVPVIYNGKAFDTYMVADLQPEIGFVQLIDNNGDEIADVIVIEAYEVVVTETFDKYNWIIHDKYSDKTIKTGEREFELKISKEGKKIQLAEASLRDELLWIKTSKNTKGKKSQVIEIVNQYVEGKVQGLADSANGKIVTMNGIEYNLSPAYAENYSKNPLINGNEYTFFFDPEGNIMHAKTLASEEYIFAVVMDMYAGNDGVDTLGQAKLFNENSEMLVLDFAEKIKVDGVYYTDYEKAITAIKRGFQSGDLVKYGTDINGDLRYVDTCYVDPINEGDNTMRFVVTAGNLYNSDTGIIDGKLIMDGNTKVFYVAKDAETGEFSKDEDDYSIGGTGVFAHHQWYQVHSYASSNVPPTEPAEIVVRSVTVGSSSGTTPNWAYDDSLMVTSVAPSIGDDGEATTMVTGYMGSTKVTKEVVYKNFDKLNVTKGTFLIIQTDSKGRISNAVKYFNRSLASDGGKYVYDSGRQLSDLTGVMIDKDFTVNGNEWDGSMSDCLIYLGRPNAMNATNIQIAEGNNDGGYVMDYAGTVYIYDFLTGDVELGSMDDVVMGSPVIARTKHCKLQTLIILKNYDWQ